MYIDVFFIYNKFSSKKYIAGYCINSMSNYSDIDRDGHEISRFGGLPRELYFPKGL